MLYNILDMMIILMCIWFSLHHDTMEILLRDEMFIPTYDDLQLQDQCSYFIDEIIWLKKRMIILNYLQCWSHSYVF
jgi:hypothetical protein